MKLKDSLCRDVVIAYYDPRKPVTVRVDASPIDKGVILLQDGDRVVCCSNRALTPESRYSQTKRESLEITWACEHFNLYLRVLHHFTSITDHETLKTVWQKIHSPLCIERLCVVRKVKDV